MTKHSAYTYIPEELQKKHIRGSSPYLLKQLISELSGAKKLSISLFLYNNPYLHDFLEELANNGTVINVYSIPLNGYDKKIHTLYKSNYLKEDAKRYSKHDYADKIQKKLTSNSKIKLKIFPHTYIWKKQKFSRGSNLYSLHNKSFLAEFDNYSKCISSSCNFALGDPPHSENFIVINDSVNAKKMFEDYFYILDKVALSIDDYSKFEDQFFDFEYVVEPINLEDKYETDYFTAPFIKYEEVGSNHYIQDKIIEFLQSAKTRIYICAQHFSDIHSFDTYADSLVDKLVDVDENIDIRILKQTRANHQMQGWRTAKTEELLKQHKNITQRYWNPIIHDKFIIVDEKILVTTGNFTATQFAWEERREMVYTVNNEEHKVLNTFSEINAYHFIDDKLVLDEYLKHFNTLWDKSIEIDD